METLLTSAEVAELAGVGTTAVKRWADSGALPCVRTAGGHRRFRRVDVEALLQAAPVSSGAWDAWIEALVGQGDTYAIQARLFEERSHRGSWHGVAHAMGGLLVEIGRRWERRQLSVIEEHLASSALQRALAAASATIPVPLQAPRCLLAAADGDEHTLGLSLVELCLREAGWRAEWAGSRTRTRDVLDRLRLGGIRMVSMSASVTMSDPAVLAQAATEIGAGCREAGVLLALGGEGAWPSDPAYGTRFRALPAFYEFARAEAARRA